MKFILLLSTLFLFGCAQRKPESSYTQNDLAPLTPAPSTSREPKVLALDTPQSADPALGLIAAGIALATNRDYYRSVAITGKCICRNSTKDTIDYPCNNVEVVLTDEEGQPITQIEPANGEFAFKVPEHKPFRIKIASARYRLSPELSKNLMRGDDIILNLYPIPAHHHP